MSRPVQSAVVIGGAGEIGQLFSGVLATSGFKVAVIDMKECAADISIVGDICAATQAIRDLVQKADLIVITLPSGVALAALQIVLPLVRSGTLIAETMPAKQPVAEAVGAAGRDVEVIGLHPAFSPDVGLAGQDIIMVPILTGPKSSELTTLLRRAGASVPTLTVLEHDRTMAQIQAATHAAIFAFGLTLKAGEPIPAGLATPPYRLLRSLLARICTGNPMAYWDIQAFNPAARGVRNTLQRSVGKINAIVEAGDPVIFANMVSGLRKMLGPSCEGYAAECLNAIRAMQPTEPLTAFTSSMKPTTDDKLEEI